MVKSNRIIIPHCIIGEIGIGAIFFVISNQSSGKSGLKHCYINIQPFVATLMASLRTPNAAFMIDSRIKFAIPSRE